MTTYVNRIAPRSEHTPTLSMGVAANHVAAVTMPLVAQDDLVIAAVPEREDPRDVLVCLDLKRIADLDLHSDRGVKVNRALLTRRAEDIIDDPEISIVMELIGGLEPARTFILKAIEKGKHVVTANKALLANFGEEVMDAAHARGVDILFEASVVDPRLERRPVRRVRGVVRGGRAGGSLVREAVNVLRVHVLRDAPIRVESDDRFTARWKRNPQGRLDRLSALSDVLRVERRHS